MYKLKINFWDGCGSVTIKSDEYEKIEKLQSFIEFMEYRDWDTTKDDDDEEDSEEEEIPPFALNTHEPL